MAVNGVPIEARPPKSLKRGPLFTGFGVLEPNKLLNKPPVPEPGGVGGGPPDLAPGNNAQIASISRFKRSISVNNSTVGIGFALICPNTSAILPNNGVACLMSRSNIPFRSLNA